MRAVADRVAEDGDAAGLTPAPPEADELGFDPDYFDPDDFDPDRFDPDNTDEDFI
mgnify:FL=1